MGREAAVSDLNVEPTLDFRPLIRQTILITPASVETNGEVSRIKIILEGDQIGPLTHIHPGQRERYHVSDGELTVKLEGKKTVLGAGHQIEVPVGAAHTFANRSDRPVAFIAEHLPALRFEEYIRSVHAFITSDAARGRRDPRTLMRYLRLESGYAETIRPPAGIPSLVVAALNGIGRLLGYPAG
jgi:mannose-6-phosphate isomerase-like protein (cupin superfamily)